MEHDVDDRVLDSVVLTDSEQPVLIAVAVEASPLATRNLQVPGLLGALVRKYQAKGGYEELWFGKVPVDGSDTRRGRRVPLRRRRPPPGPDRRRPHRRAGDRHAAGALPAVDGRARTARWRSGIIDSLTVDPDAVAGGSTDERWDVVQPDTAFGADDDAT